ncbi:hypothetical protein KIW84_076963 [Lathyrus oleraceus]|uniref:Uncharacterized protein n=1 Tax=Pisum sativum TaxID=3888 RepID=A0A9D5A042_PEA|nr:hypothetical protein KIW84_076963 [Pisum sativum]
MEKVKLKQGLKITMSISGEGNAYLQETESWRLYKQNQSLCSLVMKTAVGVCLSSCLFIRTFYAILQSRACQPSNISKPAKETKITQWPLCSANVESYNQLGKSADESDAEKIIEKPVIPLLPIKRYKYKKMFTRKLRRLVHSWMKFFFQTNRQ